ncbi:MAG TPA: hypothetical protein VGO99_08550 [Leifsonia sp.]|nr:hypothetical protein [Leifsonia sp.]
MGTLSYDGENFELDDRVLTHLQIAISTKLRRGENFFLSWQVPVERGSGRHAIWIDNGVPIHFYYSGSRAISINRDWIESMIVSAGRASGLVLIDEAEATSAS